MAPATLCEDGSVPQIVPTSPAGVVAEIVTMLGALPGRARLVIDGAPASEPGPWADQVVAALAPRPAFHLRSDRYWQPASLRFEAGRRDSDAWLERWLDVGALHREALDTFLDDGRVLPGLRDPATDRSMRATPLDMPSTGVLVLSGSALLGRGLPFDVVVHLWLSSTGLQRRTPPDDHWIIPALERYDGEACPSQEADLVVRVDDPRHPAMFRGRQP
jgi:hypothetical protein